MWVVPGWFTMDFDYMDKMKNILFHKKNKKTVVSEISRCSGFSYDYGKKLSTASSLRVARNNCLKSTLEFRVLEVFFQ